MNYEELIKTLSNEEKDKLMKLLINDKKNIDTNETLLKLSNNYKCPYCQSTKICKNGRSGKAQQFRCNNCKHNYTIKTNTCFAYSKKALELWKEYIELFCKGLSLHKIVAEMNNKISYPTAFYWRHKILEVMKNFDNHDKLDGIVEADETYFEESQKGNKKIKRPARERGYSCYKNYKNKKVCVLTAIDRQKHSFNRPVGFGKIKKDDIKILQHRIKENSILITDGERGYSNINNVKLKQLKEGKPQSKVYHINNINNFHSKLKQFMSRFNGVATKYLDNYVNYYSEVINNIDVFNQLLNINRCYLVKEIRRREVGF